MSIRKGHQFTSPLELLYRILNENQKFIYECNELQNEEIDLNNQNFRLLFIHLPHSFVSSIPRAIPRYCFT